MNYKRVILFTSCIDPKGMAKTVIVDKVQREEEYNRALQFYLDQTEFPIVIVDNTEHTYQSFHDSFSERIETLSFKGNDYDRNLGKGYGEGLIIRYALEHSSFIRNKNCKFIYKVSGRHMITNLNRLSIFMRVAEVFSDKTVFAVLREKERWATSDFFSGPVSFFHELIPYLGKCDDSKKSYFERRLFSCIQDSRKARRIRFMHVPFPLRQEGVSGSTGKPLKREGTIAKYLLKSILYILHLSSLITVYNNKIR